MTSPEGRERRPRWLRIKPQSTAPEGDTGEGSSQRDQYPPREGGGIRQVSLFSGMGVSYVNTETGKAADPQGEPIEQSQENPAMRVRRGWRRSRGLQTDGDIGDKPLGSK